MASTKWPRWRLPFAYGSAMVTSVRMPARDTRTAERPGHSAQERQRNRGGIRLAAQLVMEELQRSSEIAFRDRLAEGEELLLPHGRHHGLDVRPRDLRALAGVHGQLLQLGSDQAQVVAQPLLELQLRVAGELL